MRGIGIQAGFGEYLGSKTLQEIKSIGVEIVRIDLQTAKDNLVKTWYLCEEVINNGLQPYAIVRTPEQVLHLPYGTLVEVGNEPDLTHNGWTPETYWKTAMDCIVAANQNSLKIYIGCVSNLNRRGFNFLKSYGDWHNLASHIGVSIHRYPNGDTPQVPHTGFASREDEIQTLKELVGARPLACSEVGYHCAPHHVKSGPFGMFTKSKTWTREEVAAHMKWERDFFVGQGLDVVVAFQINDAIDITHDPEASFGFRSGSPSGYAENDWHWWPIADVWAK